MFHYIQQEEDDQDSGSGIDIVWTIQDLYIAFTFKFVNKLI